MTWYPNAPQGFESDKVRFDVVPYVAHGGIDLGCGPRKVWPHLLGIDSTKDRQLFGIDMKPDLVMDVGKLAMFADGSMPCVFSSHTLEHVEDWHGVLREWWRVLRTDGYLVLYLPHADLYPNIGQPGANPDHKHDFRNDDIIDFCRLAFPDWSLEVNQKRDQGFEYSMLLVFRKGAAGSGQQEPWSAPKPEKTAAVVRVGAHGDALWASSPIALLKEQGYHVTCYVASTGAEILRHDPNIDRLVQLPDKCLDDGELLEYWAREAPKFDRFHNLIGSVETRLLAHATEPGFYHAHALRHRLMNRNYLEMVHDYCELEHDFRQKYFPSGEEMWLAQELRNKLPAGPLVVINPGGSSPVKTWPHTQRLMQRLADEHIVCVVLGNPGIELEEIEPYAVVVGMEWPVRLALAFVQMADAVVATESLIANAVAFEPMLKVITLSHSSNENLTKHWVNTAAVEPAGLACHPCHRIHGAFTFCARDTTTGAAACQALAVPDPIADLVIEHVRQRRAA